MVNPSFDWEQFEGPESSSNTPELINESESDISSNMDEIEHPEQEPFQWGDYEDTDSYQGEPDPTEEENTVGYLVRNIATNASRLGEQFVGRYGNIEKMGKDILSNFPAAGGLLGWGLHKLMGQERWERMVKGPPGQEQRLPTSEQLKEFSQEATQGYTKPKTQGEEHFQKYIEDIGSTIGGNRGVNLRNIAVNNLGIPTAANAVQDVIENLGFGKEKGLVGKLGTWTALSLLGNVNAPQYASSLVNQGRNGMPTNQLINLTRMQNRISQVSKSPYLLHADPRSALARQELSAIQNDLANGQTSVRSMMTTYDGINAAKRNRGLFELTRNDQKFARKAIDQVKDIVRDEIMDAGANYPQALDSWKNGIQAWSVIHQSRAITNTIDSWARGPYGKIIVGPAAALFGIGAGSSFLKSAMTAGPLAVATPVVYRGMQTAYRVWQDPRLSRYYWDAISAAQRENAPAFISNYQKLNKSLEKLTPVKKHANRNNKDNHK